jgi:hypothetical protein
MAVPAATVNQRSRIVENLHSLVERTEKAYIRMGQMLPDMMKELDRGFGEARTLVGYFTGQHIQDRSASNAEQGMVGTVLEDARSVIADATFFFSGMQEADQVSFQSINDGIQNLSLLDEKLKAIREDSMEMELISLNAMTVALKAGQAGRAFSVITEELKALSGDTIGYTEKLTAEGRKILELFFQYRRDVEKIQSFQESFYAGFRAKLEGSFENFRLGVGKMAEILLQVIDGAGNTRKPLVLIMEEIQSQDIIRQSIQHVVLSLSAGADASLLDSDPQKADELLDELAFLAMLPDLSGSLLKDVEANISRGVSVFRENLGELRTLLESAEQEKRIFVEYFDSGENALAKMFEESIEGMSGLLESVEKSMAEKGKLGPEGGRILEELKDLQESFEDFVSFVDRFRTVDIAARIELAKQEVLRSKRSTMGSLTGLASRIGGDVKAALDTILVTIERIETTIRRFAVEVERGAVRVGSLVVAIRGVYARLTEAKDFLSHTMREFSLYTSRFFTLIDELEGEVEALAALEVPMAETVGELAELRAQLLARKEAALAARGLASWTIRDSRLKEMIEKFTILSHKKTAAELGGFTIEDGGKPGELTLF